MEVNLFVNKDAFSSGQIGSKIWLCEELEKIFDLIDVIWVYGGWYGITSFLLLSRNNIKIKQIRSFDIDVDCQKIADTLNENWVIDNWKFKAEVKDCNLIDFSIKPDLIINTSTEHFQIDKWWNNIPKGTAVLLQGNNMPHEDHFNSFNHIDEFSNHYKLTEIWFKGTKNFEYPDWSFSRFMLIGIR